MKKAVLFILCMVLLMPKIGLAEESSEDKRMEAQAYYAIGSRYYKQGGAQNYATALEWYEKAAILGHVKAQFDIGYMFYKGQGVIPDNMKAVEWYRESAANGYTAAQYRIGVMYKDGIGVPQDYVKAHMWFNVAAAAGSSSAARYRDSVAKRMTPSQIAVAQRMASECQSSE